MDIADFTIDGTLQVSLGFVATHGQVLTLALEQSPALDASRVVFSVVITSKDAPPLAFDPPDGKPLTPTGKVTLTLPKDGTHSYLLQCEVDDGRNALGAVDPAFTKQRIVAIKSKLGLRKLVPGETTQFSARGWTDEQNAAVDLITNAILALSPP